MRYPELTDEEIARLIDAVGTALTTMKGDNRKDKLKVFGKALLTLVFVAGGMAVSIMFPNPITIGVLGGATALIAGNKGVFRKVKKMYVCMYVCMYDPLFTRKFFTDASLINVQLVSMRGVGIIKRTIYKNISNYKTIYKRIGVTLLVHKGNLNILVIID